MMNTNHWMKYDLFFEIGWSKMILPSIRVSYLPYDDYAQSANTLFHFMKKKIVTAQ